MNEYVVYWRREVLYRTKVICYTEEEAMATVLEQFNNDSVYEEEIDELGPVEIDNAEMLEEDVDA